MANSIDLLGFTISKRRGWQVRGWYGALTGSASQFILSLSSTTPSIGELFSWKDANEMIVTAIAQSPGASFANLTAVNVLVQLYVPQTEDFITIQTLNVGAMTGGPAGTGTGTYSFGTAGLYTNFGCAGRIAVYGAGSLPGAGQLQIMCHLKG